MNKRSIFWVLLLVILFSTIGFTKERRNKGKIRMPRNFICEDVDMQRTLIWQERKRWSKLNLIQYHVEYCSLASCSFKPADCLKEQDYNKTSTSSKIPSNKCTISSSQLIFWMHYLYRISAVFSVPGTNVTRISTYTRRHCGPLVAETVLSKPNVQVLKREVNSLTISATLPEKLQRSLSSLSSVGDLSMVYKFCSKSRRKDEECSNNLTDFTEMDCKVEVIQNYRSPQQHSFANLQPSKFYCIVTTYSIAYEIKVTSNSNITEARTKIEPFPLSSQIALLIAGASSFTIFFVITWMTVERILQDSTKESEIELYESDDKCNNDQDNMQLLWREENSIESYNEKGCLSENEDNQNNISREQKAKENLAYYDHSLNLSHLVPLNSPCHCRPGFYEAK